MSDFGEIQNELRNFTCLNLDLHEIHLKIYLNFATREKSKTFLEICICTSIPKVRAEVPDSKGGGQARTCHFSLLQIIPCSNYFTKIPPLLFLRPPGKEAT